MISRVTLTNFKAHAETSLELGRLTILVGPNGVGKTSVLDAGKSGAIETRRSTA